jgi:hypothetical protein
MLWRMAALCRCYNICTYFLFLSSVAFSTSFDAYPQPFFFAFRCSKPVLTLLPADPSLRPLPNPRPFLHAYVLLHLRPHMQTPRGHTSVARPRRRWRPPPNHTSLDATARTPKKASVRHRDAQKLVRTVPGSGSGYRFGRGKAFTCDVDVDLGVGREPWRAAEGVRCRCRSSIELAPARVPSARQDQEHEHD